MQLNISKKEKLKKKSKSRKKNKSAPRAWNSAVPPKDSNKTNKNFLNQNVIHVNQILEIVAK